jgi:hypothetical protein
MTTPGDFEVLLSAKHRQDAHECSWTLFLVRTSIFGRLFLLGRPWTVILIRTLIDAHI